MECIKFHASNRLSSHQGRFGSDWTINILEYNGGGDMVQDGVERGNGGNIAYHAQGLVGQALVPKS